MGDTVRIDLGDDRRVRGSRLAGPRHRSTRQSPPRLFPCSALSSAIGTCKSGFTLLRPQPASRPAITLSRVIDLLFEDWVLAVHAVEKIVGARLPVGRPDHVHVIGMDLLRRRGHIASIGRAEVPHHPGMRLQDSGQIRFRHRVFRLISAEPVNAIDRIVPAPVVFQLRSERCYRSRRSDRSAADPCRKSKRSAPPVSPRAEFHTTR